MMNLEKGEVYILDFGKGHKGSLVVGAVYKAESGKYYTFDDLGVEIRLVNKDFADITVYEFSDTYLSDNYNCKFNLYDEIEYLDEIYTIVGYYTMSRKYYMVNDEGVSLEEFADDIETLEAL